MRPIRGLSIMFVGSLLLLASLALPAPAKAAPLNATDTEAFMRKAASTPPGITVMSDYFQDLGTRAPSLCFQQQTIDGKVRFTPVQLSEAAPVGWLANQGMSQGASAGYYVRVYQFPSAAKARKAGAELVKATCPDATDPVYYLKQTKRTITQAKAKASVAITSSMKDDGQIETTESIFRIVGNALLEVTATYVGEPDSALGKQLRAQLPKSMEKVAAAYRSAR